MLFLPAAMSVLLLSACATTEGYEKKVHAWPGQPVKQLIKKWGEPDLILPLKNGNKEYQYLKDQEVTVPQRNTDPLAYNRELIEQADTRRRQTESFMPPQGPSWNSHLVSPSFSLFSAPVDSYNGKGIKKCFIAILFLKLTQTGVSFLFVLKVISVLLNFYRLYRVLTAIHPTHHSEEQFLAESIHFYYLNGVK